MFALAVIGILPALAQIQVRAEEPFAIELIDGEFLYGFADEEVLDSGSNTGIQVDVDAPWLRALERHKTLSLREVKDHRRERPDAREQRYLANGYVLVKGPAGSLAVEASEFELARRSSALASALARERADATEVQLQFLESSRGAEVDVGEPGFMEQWRRHLIVAGLCATLGLLVVRTLILR
ncbi:MAG: hypothetical protein QGG73_06545 [Candidatus Hydrogenedentes bacterium]|jgi:hypothetical protein|nr:hypothetical protein [Candidatus Hydrogenedentota bacterium]